MFIRVIIDALMVFPRGCLSGVSNYAEEEIEISFVTALDF